VHVTKKGVVFAHRRENLTVGLMEQYISFRENTWDEIGRHGLVERFLKLWLLEGRCVEWRRPR
jgi:hypothetical protein